MFGVWVIWQDAASACYGDFQLYVSEDDGSDDSTEASGPTMALQNLGWGIWPNFLHPCRQLVFCSFMCKEELPSIYYVTVIGAIMIYTVYIYIYCVCINMQLRRLVAPGVVYYAASWYVLCFLQPCCQDVYNCRQSPNFVPFCASFGSSNGNPWFIELINACLLV